MVVRLNEMDGWVDGLMHEISRLLLAMERYAIYDSLLQGLRTYAIYS